MPSSPTLEHAIGVFLTRVDRSGDCWVWQGALNGGGYGYFARGKRFLGTYVAHRWHYLAVVGPLADDLVLDHLCRVRSCVNLDHLEAVSFAENLARGEGVAAANTRKTHCNCGERLEKNPHNSGRYCRPCFRAYQNKYARQRRASSQVTDLHHPE